MDLSEQPPGQTLLQGAPHGDEVEEVCGVVLCERRAEGTLVGVEIVVLPVLNGSDL